MWLEGFPEGADDLGACKETDELGSDGAHVTNIVRHHFRYEWHTAAGKLAPLITQSRLNLTLQNEHDFLSAVGVCADFTAHFQFEVHESRILRANTAETREVSEVRMVGVVTPIGFAGIV